ncbi:MAG: glutamate racemase [Cytophagia bacterium]|nr:glutamate racemase [Cytophagia bacterium]
MEKNDPIGIFDSGLGGLTVANAVYRQLKNEQLIYFGDSAHLPYGDKSAATIQAYSVKICDVLLQKNAKLILIACNSASAAAFELVKAYVGSKAKVLNVIDPVVNYVAEKYAGKHVGLIGTKQTVGSGVYEYQLKVKDPAIKFSALATPLLVPMIEEGFHNNNISEAIIEQYLNDPVLQGIDTLILGCTHYPLIKGEIDKYYRGKIEVIDSSTIVARALKKYLEEEGLSSEKVVADHEFLVSDITPSFEKAAELFFGRKVPLQKHILWE